jgi:hypothetical protein
MIFPCQTANILAAMEQSFISDKAKNNIISIDNGVIMSNKGAVEHSFLMEIFRVTFGIKINIENFSLILISFWLKI